MADPASTTQAIAAGGTAALIVGPPGSLELVIGCAIFGALLSIWASAAKTELTARALFGLLGQFGASVAVGIGGTAAVQTVGPAYSLIEPITHAPGWVLSLSLAGFAQVLIPALRNLINRKASDV